MNTHKLFNWVVIVSLPLLFVLALPFTEVVAAPLGDGTTLLPDTHSTTPLIIEGKVEQIITTRRADGLITSRAMVIVEKVIQGTMPDSRISIRYLGGTVGELTLEVSGEPKLAKGMRLQATLTPITNNEYRIANLDTDLTILTGEIGVTYVPTGEKWFDSDLPIPFLINANTGDVPGDSESIAVQSAMTTWNNAACSYFSYSYQSGSCTTGPILDGVNCISWSTQSGDGALARAFYWYNASTHQMQETDIVFYDGDHNWSISPGSGQFDVESVGLHELGHSLGLAHTEYANTNIVMYYAIGNGETRRSLHTDDLNGICSIYPIPAAPSNLTATAVSPSQIDLSWTDNSSNEDGFKIERSSTGSGDWVELDTVEPNITTYSDTTPTCESTYYYRLRASKLSEYSSYSNITNTTTLTCTSPVYLPIILK